MAASLKTCQASEVINIKDFLSKWDNNVYQLCAQSDFDQNTEIADKMEMSHENVEELESVCSLDLLKSGYDRTADRWRHLEWIPSDLDLMCVRFQKHELEQRAKSAVYLNGVLRKMKYRKSDQYLMYHSSNSQESLKYSDIAEEFRVIYPDVLITVNINRPIKQKASMQDEQAGKAEQRILSSTLLILGRQKLTDLRDIIRCVHDLSVAGDLSENPDTENQTYAKDMFKSGFFFIEGTFYNDMRENDARDYSEVIRNWAKGRGFGTIDSQRMEDTIFLDLNLRLGQPYVYMHQGDCEHIIIFSDIRLLCSDDPQDTRRYPYLLRKCRRNRTLCRVCGMQAARWIVYGSEFTPETPCFFCDICFRNLHYDQENKKLGEFEAYRFFDQHAII